MNNTNSVYNKLLQQFGDKEFSINDILNKKIFGDNEKDILEILNKLKEKGLLIFDKEKNKYKLLIKSFANYSNLKSSLKKAADLVRNMSDGYKILLVLLFYKAFSDIWKKEYIEAKDQLIKQGLPEKDAEKLSKLEGYHIINIPEEYLWENILRTREGLIEKLIKALRTISERNLKLSDSINRLLRYIEDLRNKEGSDLLIRQAMEVFNNIDFSNLDFDALGYAYEWLIEQFMPAQKKAGELFTPREVIEVLVRILDPSKERRKILDPAAGSGGMLIEVYKYVRNNYGEDVAKELILVGQEINDDTYAILELNFLLHGIELGKNVKLYRGDSILNPGFKNDGPFDIIIFNPPWNDDRYNEEVLKKSAIKEIFDKYGFPPKTSADWAWILLSLNYVNDNGKVGIVIDNGTLFRGGREKTIRSKIIENDWVECVILLPDKLFYNTGAPGAIIIFNKNKPENRKKKILFINASNYYENHPDIKKMNKLSREGIEKIVEVYKEWKEIPEFSKTVSIEEVIKNDYSLNVTLYVYNNLQNEEINIKEVWEELEKVNKELNELEGKINEWINEITKII
ncbi:restriction endonuclease subunit M [Nanoarchaeota archaeon]